MLMQSALEMAIFTLLILGIIWEDKLARWEQKWKKRITRHFRRRPKAQVLSFEKYKNSRHYSA